MTIRRWRRVAEIAQAAVVVGLPFVTIRGESALRLDVPTLRLHAFGAAIWVDELFVVLAATLAGIFAFLLVTLLYGRLWCGWACPQTALLDLTGFLDRGRRAGGWRALAAHAAVALAAVLVSANLLWYFVPPLEFARGLAAFSSHPVVNGAWIVTAGIVFADLAFWRHGFCATTCPYARFQGALLDRHSMAIAYDTRREDDCVDCKACVRVCPVGIDIRRGLQAACTSCGACIDACAPIMARLGRPPGLIGYFFGAPGTRARWLRPGVAALAVLTAASLALTAAVAQGRTDLELTVTSSGETRAHRLPSGETYHPVGLALENRGRGPLRVALALSAPGVEARLRPDEVLLAPGEHRRLTVSVTARGLAPGSITPARLSARAAGPRAIALERTVELAAPPVQGGGGR